MSAVVQRPWKFGAEESKSALGSVRRRRASPSVSPLSLRSFVLPAVFGAACSNNASVPIAAPMRPPTPASVSVKEPGGDAVDPERAALERLLGEPWGARTDKDEQLLAPMPDWEHWKRTRYFGFDHLVGFRYGNEHHAMVAVRVQELPENTPV